MDKDLTIFSLLTLLTLLTFKLLKQPLPTILRTLCDAYLQSSASNINSLTHTYDELQVDASLESTHELMSATFPTHSTGMFQLLSVPVAHALRVRKRGFGPVTNVQDTVGK